MALGFCKQARVFTKSSIAPHIAMFPTPGDSGGRKQHTGPHARELHSHLVMANYDPAPGSSARFLSSVYTAACVKLSRAAFVHGVS